MLTSAASSEKYVNSECISTNSNCGTARFSVKSCLNHRLYIKKVYDDITLLEREMSILAAFLEAYEDDSEDTRPFLLMNDVLMDECSAIFESDFLAKDCSFHQWVLKSYLEKDFSVKIFHFLQNDIFPALAWLEEREIVHGNICAENFSLNDGVLVLCNFELGGYEGDLSITTDKIQPFYTSPEARRSLERDRNPQISLFSDAFQLGAMLSDIHSRPKPFTFWSEEKEVKCYATPEILLRFLKSLPDASFIYASLLFDDLNRPTTSLFSPTMKLKPPPVGLMKVTADELFKGWNGYSKKLDISLLIPKNPKIYVKPFLCLLAAFFLNFVQTGVMITIYEGTTALAIANVNANE